MPHQLIHHSHSKAAHLAVAACSFWKVCLTYLILIWLDLGWSFSLEWVGSFLDYKLSYYDWDSLCVCMYGNKARIQEGCCWGMGLDFEVCVCSCLFEWNWKLFCCLLMKTSYLFHSTDSKQLAVARFHLPFGMKLMRQDSQEMLCEFILVLWLVLSWRQYWQIWSWCSQHSLQGIY